tara:strand:- start:1137 stop:1361 length:225 start_codon:yes stop_codon:yes gene_type:complete
MVAMIIPTKKIPVAKMPKNKRMETLIKHLADLEAADYERLSSDGRHYLGKIWNLLGMPSQEEIEIPKELKDAKS